MLGSFYENFCYRVNVCIAAKLTDNRRHLEAACLLADYANVCASCVFCVYYKFKLSFLADRIARVFISYLHDTIVCLSVTVAVHCD